MSNRKFVYCENTEGGMALFEIESNPLASSLRGWMSEDTKADDTCLVEWMESASIGEWTEHRLGAVFCVATPKSEADEGRQLRKAAQFTGDPGWLPSGDAGRKLTQAEELDLANELVSAASGVIAEHDATRGQVRGASRDIERLRLVVKRASS